MTSLTPNEDRARAIMEATATANASLETPSTTSRIVLHMSNELLLVQAREYDRGASPEEVVEATILALVTQAANLIVGCGDDPRLQLYGLLDQIAALAPAEIAHRLQQPAEYSMQCRPDGVRA